MPEHERYRGSLFLSKRQELRREVATDIAVERHEVCHPETVEDGEQQQWVFGGLTQRFRSLDKQACLLDGRFGFRRRIAFDVHQSICERDLQLDLLATPHRRGR